MFTFIVLALIGAVLCAFIGYSLPQKAFTFDLEDVRFDRNYREAEHYERLLRSARRDKRRNHTPGLRPEWQAVVILEDLNEFELDEFLAREVWGSKGLQNERLNLSPYKKEIKEIWKRTQKPVAYA